MPQNEQSLITEVLIPKLQEPCYVLQFSLLKKINLKKEKHLSKLIHLKSRYYVQVYLAPTYDKDFILTLWRKNKNGTLEACSHFDLSEYNTITVVEKVKACLIDNIILDRSFERPIQIVSYEFKGGL